MRSICNIISTFSPFVVPPLGGIDITAHALPPKGGTTNKRRLRARRDQGLQLLSPPSDECKRCLAFTLIEMLIVISIISVLLGLLYGAIERAQKFSRRTIVFTELKSIESAFKQYQAYYHKWPSSSNGLVNAASQLKSGDDDGFIIDESHARMLQGVRTDSGADWDLSLNPESIPFIEFSRFDPVLRAPVNPFKPNNGYGQDTMRQFKVLFDTDGDRQIMVTDNTVVPTWAGTNIIASVAVWTIIPATRQSGSSGEIKNTGDVVFGSWDTFSVK